jgi:hypothetical protein
MEGVEKMAKKPNSSRNNNRWLYGGFVVLGVLAVWIGVMLGNYLLNRVADSGDKDIVQNDTVNIAPVDIESRDISSQTTSADLPDDSVSETNQSLYRVRVGRYSGVSIAKKAEAELQALGYDTYVLGSGSGPYYVQVGAFRQKENADRVVQELKEKGYEVYVMH